MIQITEKEHARLRKVEQIAWKALQAMETLKQAREHPVKSKELDLACAVADELRESLFVEEVPGK